MAVKIDVITKGDIKIILQRHKARHRVGRGAVHADLTVSIQGHEGEGWVNALVDHLKVEPVHLRHGFPIGNTRATQRIDADVDARIGDRLQVDHVDQILDVGV